MLVSIKKWWKISLIVIISVLILIYYVFLKSDKDAIDPATTSAKLKEGLAEIKDKITEVQNNAVVETAISRTKVQAVKEDLNDISKEKDSIKRRTRLAELAKRVS